MSIERADEARPGTAISQTYRVEWQDTDASGHYHHATVVRWVEAAQFALYESIGARGMFERIVPVHYSVDYRSRVWFGDAVTATLTLASIGRASLKLAFSVTSGSTLVAEGQIVTVHLPDGDGAAEWPEDVRAALQSAQGDPTVPE